MLHTEERIALNRSAGLSRSSEKGYYYRKLEMSGITLNILLLAIGIISAVNAQTQSCKACNCQIRNTKALNTIIEAQVNHALAKEPRKLLRLYLKLSVTNY